MFQAFQRVWRRLWRTHHRSAQKGLQGFIILATLTFLALTLRRHWHQVATLRLESQAWGHLAIAALLLLLAYGWIGWVWAWILRDLGVSVSARWAIAVFLITNLAKYLPSNLLHLYGRTIAAIKIGIPSHLAALSVLLDALLLVVAGVAVGLLGATGGMLSFGMVLLPTLFLLLLHPKVIRVLNRRLARLFKGEGAGTGKAIALQRYPWLPQLGAVIHVLLRGMSFVVTVMAFIPVSVSLSLKLMGTFSVGWLLGYVTPGLPGGIGVFEATLIALLSHPSSTDGLPMGALLGAIAVHRLLTTIAEAVGAGLAYPFCPLTVNPITAEEKGLH